MWIGILGVTDQSVGKLNPEAFVLNPEGILPSRPHRSFVTCQAQDWVHSRTGRTCVTREESGRGQHPCTHFTWEESVPISQTRK